MIKKNRKPDTVDIKTFKQEFSSVQSDVNSIKKSLKQLHKLAKAVAKRSGKLLRFADKKLYIEDQKGYGYINPAYKTLPKAVTKLECFENIEIDIAALLYDISC